MFSIGLYIAIAVGIILLLSIIPGVKIFVQPLLMLAVATIAYVGKVGIDWVVYFFKSLFNAHLTIGRHLMMSRRTFDPSISVKEAERGTNSG